jgi:hypothetical protein
MIDPIGQELIDVAVKEAGNSLRAKIARSVVRLIAGGPGFKYLDQIRANENTLEGRRKIDALVAEEVARQAIADPDYMERAKARFLGEMYSKQENLEAVAAKAHEEILNLTDDEILSDEGEVPSDDWMNAFTREAELASSDELRQRLGKILARETRKPGSYSRSTVRLIAELEKETLELFNDFIRYSIGSIILKGADWDKGDRLINTSNLQSAGILSSQPSMTWDCEIGENGNVWLTGNDLYLVICGEASSKLKIPILMLTPVGAELLSLMDAKSDPIALQESVNGWQKTGISKVVVGPAVNQDGLTRVVASHVLFQKDGEQ